MNLDHATVKRKVQNSLNIEICLAIGYLQVMTTLLAHPDADQIMLANVMTALGDETRLAMIGYLACTGNRELTCSQFSELGSKTVLSYHVAKLREAGVCRVRPEGTRRYVSLRVDDLNARFPGLLDAIIASAGDYRLPADQIAALEAGNVEAHA